jgi:hypothetical protein
MAKSATQLVAELQAATAAVLQATAAGLHVIAVSLDNWKSPTLLVVSTPALNDLPGARYIGACPDGAEEWSAPFAGIVIQWFRVQCQRRAAS